MPRRLRVEARPAVVEYDEVELMNHVVHRNVGDNFISLYFFFNLNNL